MTAYVIARVNVTDPDRYGEYRKLTPDAIAAYGGRFVVRGGALETLEGPAEARRVVVIEFPDMATAQRFYESPEYRRAREVREGAAEAQMIVVEGV